MYTYICNLFINIKYHSDICYLYLLNFQMIILIISYRKTIYIYSIVYYREYTTKLY